MLQKLLTKNKLIVLISDFHVIGMHYIVTVCTILSLAYLVDIVLFVNHRFHAKYRNFRAFVKIN